MRKFRSAFTMLELVFVIIVMGVLGKFGVEFLAQAYNNFIYSTLNNTLQSHSATTIEFISSRLQYRIKDSIIAKNSSDNSFVALGSATGGNYNILEWVGADIDGFRGDTDSTWSGIIDLDHTDATVSRLISPGTDTTKVNSLIQTLSTNSVTDMNDTALYFIGSDSDIALDYGWSGNSAYIADQNGSIHPVISTGNANEFAPASSNFSGVEIFEYYKLAWSAYALVLDTSNGDLWFHSDYQPWQGETYNNANEINLLMKNVDTFQFMAIGSIVKIQICVNSNLLEDYSICKEKTIY